MSNNIANQKQLIKINDFDRPLKVKLAGNISLLIEEPFIMADENLLSVLDSYQISYERTHDIKNVSESMKINFTNELVRNILVEFISKTQENEIKFCIKDIVSISDLMQAIGYSKDDELTIDMAVDSLPKKPRLTIHSQKNDQVNIVQDIVSGDQRKLSILDTTSSEITKYISYKGNGLNIYSKVISDKSKDDLSDITIKYKEESCYIRIRINFVNKNRRLVLRCYYSVGNQTHNNSSNIDLLQNSLSPLLEYLKSIPATHNFESNEDILKLLNTLDYDLLSSITYINHISHTNDFTIDFNHHPYRIEKLWYKGVEINESDYLCKVGCFTIENKKGRNYETINNVNISNIHPYTKLEKIEMRHEAVNRINQALELKEEIIKLRESRDPIIRVKKYY